MSHIEVEEIVMEDVSMFIEFDIMDYVYMILVIVCGISIIKNLRS